MKDATTMRIKRSALEKIKQKKLIWEIDNKQWISLSDFLEQLISDVE